MSFRWVTMWCLWKSPNGPILHLVKSRALRYHAGLETKELTRMKIHGGNKSHKGTRVAIKQTFGGWKRRFHLLHSEVQMSPEKTCQLIGACAVLHNIAVLRNEPTDGIHCDEDQPVIALPWPRKWKRCERLYFQHVFLNHIFTLRHKTELKM